MNPWRRIPRPALTALAGLIACASTSVERREYILAHPHGWIELTIADVAIPDVPKSPEDPGAIERPDTCGVQIDLDRETFVDGVVYPTGERAPYTVRSGFRLPAPLGAASVSVSYRACDRADGQRSNTRAEIAISVVEDHVTELHFDGTSLVADPPRVDPVVTLDDLYEAITGQRKGLPTP